MDRLYGRFEAKLETFVNIVLVFLRDIGFEFKVDKCVALVLKLEVSVGSKWIVLPDGQVMSEIDESGDEYFGDLEDEDKMQQDMKEKVRK